LFLGVAYDQQTGHDGFAGARIVSEQVAQRLSRQQFPVVGQDRSPAIPCQPDMFVITRQHERVNW
jgi:hypothetical protein